MTHFVLVVHSDPERKAPLGSMRTITDFLANVMTHVMRPRGRTIDLLERVMSPAGTTPPTELRELLAQARLIRAEFQALSIERLYKFEMRIPKERVADLRDLAGRSSVTLEDLMERGVTWGEAPCSRPEIEAACAGLALERGADGALTLADAFGGVLDSIERIAAHGLEANREISCR